MFEIQELLAGYPVIIQQEVIWGDMDAYRHVNNVTYFRYFENVRVEYLRRIGWAEVERETGIGPIVSSLHARFRRPVNFPDTISIGAKLSKIGEDRFSLHHIVVSHTQQAVTTEGESTIVTYHYKEGKKKPIPEKMRAKIEELESLGHK